VMDDDSHGDFSLAVGLLCGISPIFAVNFS
jgi:hypothetical protein